MSCTEEHEEIASKLDKIEATLEYHTGEVHGKLVPPEKILLKDDALSADNRIEGKLDAFAKESKTDREEIHRQNDEMADVVLGKKSIDYDGKIIRTGGMKAIVDDNENGGLRFKWANLIIGSLITVIVAVIGLAGVVISHNEDSQVVVDQVMEEIQQQLEEIIELELAEK